MLNARDRHQFRLLSKSAVRQLIDTALFSRDGDPMEFAMWMMALIATPPAFFAARQMLAYSALENAPVDVVQGVALAHRLFFICYAMLAAGFLAALTWEAVFPDGRDQEIVGVLPVRPHVFAASRLAAALRVAVIFAAVVNLPAAAIYSLFAMGHPLFAWNLPGLFVGHALATMLASLMIFLLLLTARGVTAVLFGAGAGRWVGAGLQLVTVVLMFEAFFFLPGILGALARQVTAGDETALLFPPVWFAGLHAWLVGSADALLETAMIRGVLAIASAAVLVVPVYLLPAPWLGQRALHKRSRERAAATTFVVRMVSSVTRARPSVRSVYLFALISLVRSRQHHLLLASYAGIAVAMSLASIWLIEDRGSIKLDRPASWMLTLPMLFVFFGAQGLRSAFRVPTEVEANWPFRIAPPSLTTCVNASVLALVTAVCLPIAVATLAIVGPRWAFSETLLVVALQLLAGWTLSEMLLSRWRKVPFACAHAPSPDVLKAWWPAWGVAVYLFAFKMSDWQFASLQSTSALVAYVATCLTLVAVIRIARYRELRTRPLEFDLAPSGTERLNLSEAVN